MTAQKKVAQQIAAATKRRERQERHERLMQQHAEKRAQQQAHLDALDRWYEDGMIGPRPIHPDNVRPVEALNDVDLLRAAEELGIDLSGVRA